MSRKLIQHFTRIHLRLMIEGIWHDSRNILHQHGVRFNLEGITDEPINWTTAGEEDRKAFVDDCFCADYVVLRIHLCDEEMKHHRVRIMLIPENGLDILSDWSPAEMPEGLEYIEARIREFMDAMEEWS